MAKRIDPNELKAFLDEKVATYNQPGFIADDPVSIPHLFTKKQDIEIAGLFAATLAWGQRKTIIRKCRELMAMMDNDPHAFIVNHSDADLKPFEDFKHRTFNATDTLYFIEWLRWFYSRHNSLEEAFLVPPDEKTVENGLIGFHNVFFGLPDGSTQLCRYQCGCFIDLTGSNPQFFQFYPIKFIGVFIKNVSFSIISL